MENVIYYHQEHVCNSFFDGVGKFLKMASFGVSEQFWCPGGPKITPDATKMMNFEHQRVAKSLKRVYQLINQPYICIRVLSITQNHDKECIVASSQHFLVKIKKNVKQKVFVINFLCNALEIMFIEYLEQKTMRTNMKKKNPVFPKIMGKQVKIKTPN